MKHYCHNNSAAVSGHLKHCMPVLRGHGPASRVALPLQGKGSSLSPGEGGWGSWRGWCVDVRGQRCKSCHERGELSANVLSHVREGGREREGWRGSEGWREDEV